MNAAEATTQTEPLKDAPDVLLRAEHVTKVVPGTTW